jgi:WD40 repeat protein
VHLWDSNSQREIATLSDIMFCVMSSTFSPDGRRLVVGSNSLDGVSLWDVESREELLVMEMEGPLYHFAFSPDGDLLAGGSLASNLLQVWRAPSCAEIEAAEKVQAAKTEKP